MNGLKFVEKKPLPGSHCRGFETGFGSVLKPVVDTRFAFDEWIKGSDVKAYKKQKGAVIVMGGEMGQTGWGNGGRADARVANTGPHVERKMYASTLCIGHKIGEVPRGVESMTVPISALAAAIRAQGLVTMQHASDRLRRNIREFSSQSDYDLTTSALEGISEYVFDREYFDFCKGVYDRASRWILGHSGTKYPGGILMIDDGAYFEKREPVLHWKALAPSYEEMCSTTPYEGARIWTNVFPD